MKLWRSACSVTLFLIPAASAASWNRRLSWRVVIGLQPIDRRAALRLIVEIAIAEGLAVRRIDQGRGAADGGEFGQAARSCC